MSPLEIKREKKIYVHFFTSYTLSLKHVRLHIYAKQHRSKVVAVCGQKIS